MLASDTSNTPVTDNTPVTITVHERLSWDEICQRYPDTWVVAVSPERADEKDEADDVTIEFCTAVVIAHHKNRKSLIPFIKTEQHRYEELGAYFTGRLISPSYELVMR